MAQADAAAPGAAEPRPAAEPGRLGFLPLRAPEGSELARVRFRALAVPCEGSCTELRVAEGDDTVEDPETVDMASGAKIWEGAVDLARHIANLSADAKRELHGSRVLELGAGHGVPGIIAARCLGADVHFHDRSPDILRRVTAVNVAANGCASGGRGGKAGGEAGGERRAGPRFLGGDWRELLSVARAGGLTYDVVLAAEAIYKLETYADLAALLSQCLAPGGVAWFAGKRFYFGCGGGTASFAASLRDAGFSVGVERVIEDGRSNVREILRITHKPIRAGDTDDNHKHEEDAGDCGGMKARGPEDSEAGGHSKRRKLVP